MENNNPQEQQENYSEEAEGRNPIISVLLYGVAVIVLASIAKVIVTWVNYPASISSLKEFFETIIDSFVYVLNFDFKVWWVFVLVLYLVARFYKKD